jgi:hypothetical protein
MTEHEIPQERDLPPGRLAQMKDDVMAEINQDIDQETEAAPQAVPLRPRLRWRRAGLVAAAAAAALGLTATIVATGDDSASANTAVLDDDGNIVITLEEGKHPEELERRLEDLGLPAEVDFLESGYSCDRSRSTGWVQESEESLVVDSPDTRQGQFILDPEALPPGQTAALEFYFDEFEDDAASLWVVSRSTTDIGECVPVESAVIVDAEEGISGG